MKSISMGYGDALSLGIPAKLLNSIGSGRDFNRIPPSLSTEIGDNFGSGCAYPPDTRFARRRRCRHRGIGGDRPRHHAAQPFPGARIVIRDAGGLPAGNQPEQGGIVTRVRAGAVRLRKP